MNDQELDEIIRLLRQIREVLDDLTREPTAIVPPSIWRELHDAITDLGDPGLTSPPLLGSGPAFTRARTSLELLKEGADERWAGPGIENRDDMLVGLERHGFSGSQLRLKAAVMDTAYANYVSLGRASEVPKNDPGWMRSTARRLQRFLAPSTTFLDSLSNVPGFSFLGFVSEAISTTDHAIGIADID